MKTNQKSLKIGIFLILALFSIVAISSFASACQFNSFGCYDLIKFNPNLLIPTGTSFGLNSYQGVVNVTKVDVKWGDSHSGCMGRIEYAGGNSSWKDVHTSEIEKFTFSSNLKINITDIKIAVMPKNAKATCKPVKIDWVYVRGACGNNTIPGNETNETNETVDTLAPIVTINSPTPSTYNVSNVLFDFSVNDTDGSVDTTWFTLNGSRYEYDDAPTTLTLANGTYNLIAYANDTAGHIGNASLNFTVLLSGNDNNNTNPGNNTNSTNQTTIPVITIHSPNNFSGTSNAFIIDATSDQIIVQWFYSLNGGNLTQFNVSSTILYARNGSNTLFVEGINANNTAGNATKIFSYTYDSGSNDNGNNDDHHDVIDDDPVFVKKTNFIENDTASVSKDNGIIKLLSLGNNDSLMFRSAVYWLVLVVLALLILIVLVIIIRKLRGH